MASFDVIFIGGGPAGYVGAIRCAQLGLSVAVVEREALGGTCVLWGCIPAKALLEAAALANRVRHAGEFGVQVGDVKFDYSVAMKRSRAVSSQNSKGVEFLFKKNKVEWLKGRASFESADTVKVGERTVRAKNIVIATGSSVTPLPGVEVDQKRIVDSTGALELAAVPKHMVVIGGGVIGLELGSVWLRLGAKVTVVEYLDQILPGMDGDVRKEANKIFKKQGFDLKLGTKVTGATVEGENVKLTVEPAKPVLSNAAGGAEGSMPASRCSTGEQKALLLGLVLAHAELVAARRGAPPIVLLDEVAAHLDPHRRAALFDRLQGRGQVWMTATEASLFEGIGTASRFHVEGGQAVPA